MKLLSACFAAALAMMPMAAAAQGSWTADNGNGTFTNPLFYDEFSDPDILRVGDDYYLAGTTMHTVPGVNILHSKDLVNWEQVSYCFDRFDFADPAFSLQDGKEVYGQGVWAPCIRYSNGKFYVFRKGTQIEIMLITSQYVWYDALRFLNLTIPHQCRNTLAQFFNIEHLLVIFII